MQILVPAHIRDQVTTALRAILPTVHTIPLDSQRPPPPNDAEILLRFFPNAAYPGRVFDAAALQRAVAASPRLRWIHNGMTGMDGVLYPQLVASDILVTNGAGAHRHAIAESTLAMMLALAKRLPQHFQDQQQRQWRHIPHDALRGRHALILGLGHIGRQIAHLCHAFGMHVTAIKRHPSGDPIPAVAAVASPAQLHDHLPHADYLIIAVVLTPETHNMIAEPQLRLMKPTAYLVNIARGGVVHEPALLRALHQGTIAGAAIDVFTQEPLPPDSPFWTAPNTLITPHNAAWSPHVQEEALAIFYENFRRYLQNAPLLNQVNKAAGY